MKKFLIAFTVFLTWSFFGLWLYSWFQIKETPSITSSELAEISPTDNSKSETEKTVKKIEESEIISPVDSRSNYKKTNTSGLKGISNDGDLIFMFKDGVSILENNSEIVIPEAVTDFKYKTNSYLLEHPDMEVHINSLYSATENFESPNLGVQRGIKIKNVLLSVGIPKEKIVIKPIIKGINFDEEGRFNNSISIVFKPLDQERIKNEQQELPKSRIVYPKFSNTGLLVNRNLKNLLEEVIDIVKDHPDLKIEIIGHSDNIGNAEDNYNLALNYAKQVEWYLVAKGSIRNSMIKASSKGESEPIGDNNNELGRVANRRVEVVFYK